MPLGNIKRKLNAAIEFESVRDKLIDEIIIENSEYLSDLLRAQLREGRTASGRPVTIFTSEAYKPYTVKFKKTFGIELGRVTSRITNYMTGLFYSSLRLSSYPKEMRFLSDVPYYPQIIARSEPDTFILSEEHFIQFVEEKLKPELKLRLKQMLG